MLVTSTLTETKEVTREVKLPYHSKDRNTFYRINPDESILCITQGKDWANVDFSKKSAIGYKNLVDKAIRASECDEAEIFNALQAATTMVDTMHD